MKALSWVVLSAVVVSAGSVKAEPPEPAVTGSSSRGFLSGAGVTLIGLGVAGLAVGISGVLIGADARSTLSSYGTPTQGEAPTALDLNSRVQTGNTLALAGFIGGAALIGAGIAMLIADAPHRLTVAFVPSRQGGMLGARFEF
jgi:hypothetical protein